MSERSTRPPPFDDRPRAMTPLAEFDGRPKVASEPVDPFGSVPRIPRAPRVPSSTEQLRPPPAELHDTIPTPSHSGERLEMHDATDETTPPDGPFAIRQVLKQLKKFEEGFARMERHCEVAANSSLATAQDVKLLRREFQELKKEHGDRLVRLELDRLWVPRVAAAASLLVSLLTALYVVIKLH